MGSEKSHQRKFTIYFWSDAFFHAIAVGCLESFAILYAVKRGLGDFEIALIGTLPLLVGSFASLIIPAFVRQQNLRKYLLASNILQTLGMGIFLASTYFEQPFYIMITALCLAWTGGLIASPLWTDWVNLWLPKKNLGRILATRTSFVALVSIVVYLSLTWFINHLEDLEIFRAIFGFGICARLASGMSMFKQARLPLPEHAKLQTSELPWRSLKDSLQDVSLVRLLAIILGFKLIANIAGPFLAPYVTKELHFSSFELAILMAMPTLGRFLFLTSWSEIIQTYRPRVAIIIAIFGISVSSIFWFFARSWIGLGTIEAICGVLWTGLDLCVILYFQDIVKGRARALTGLYIFGSQAVTLVGAGLGHLILPYASSLHALFEASAVLRMAFTLVLLAVILQRNQQKWRPSEDALNPS